MNWYPPPPKSLPHRLVPDRFRIGVGIICFYYIDTCEILKFSNEIIGYYMAFFISYPLSTLGSRDDIWTRVWYEKWHVMICLSYNSTEEIALQVNTVFRKFMKWRVINLGTLKERHVITSRKQLINMFYQTAWAIFVKLGEINIIPLIILNKTQSFITR